MSKLASEYLLPPPDTAMVTRAPLQLLQNDQRLFSGNYDFFCVRFKKHFAVALLVKRSHKNIVLIFDIEEMDHSWK